MPEVFLESFEGEDVSIREGEGEVVFSIGCIELFEEGAKSWIVKLYTIGALWKHYFTVLI